MKRRSTTIGASPMLSSSTRSAFGRRISARAIASICCSPPDRAPARNFQRGSSAGKSSSTDCGSGPFRPDATRRFSSTVSVVNSSRLSGTSTMPAFAAAVARPVRSETPSTAIVPFVRGEQAGQGEEQRGLSRAVRAEDRMDGARVDREVDVAKRGERAPTAGETGTLEPCAHVAADRSCSVPEVRIGETAIAADRRRSPSTITLPKSST